MKHRLWLLSALIFTLFISACVSTGVPLEVRVNLTNSGQTVMMHRGQELIVELRKEAGVPSRWVVRSNGVKVFNAGAIRQVVQIEGQPYVVERYIFTAMRVAQDSINLELLRNDRSDATPLETFTLTVNVKQ